jgi:hypothetical protein
MCLLARVFKDDIENLIEGDHKTEVAMLENSTMAEERLTTPRRPNFGFAKKE